MLELLQQLVRADTSNPPGETLNVLPTVATIDLDGRMLLPRSIDGARLLHAPDERIPVDALEPGTRALSSIIERYR